MEIELLRGGCAGRVTCKNVNKKCCNPLPKNNNDFIECNYYKNPWAKNTRPRGLMKYFLRQDPTDKVKRPYYKRIIARHFLKYYIFYLINLNRGRLKKNLLTRKERKSPGCLDCGLCCVNCEAYNDECKLWKFNSLLNCKEYPITPLQLKLDNLEEKCRFYWE